MRSGIYVYYISYMDVRWVWGYRNKSVYTNKYMYAIVYMARLLNTIIFYFLDWSNSTAPIPTYRQNLYIYSSRTMIVLHCAW